MISDGGKASITERENDILRLLAEGLSNQEIAERLLITRATVNTHVLSLLRKLSARNRTHAVVKAYRLHILDLRE
ncbi:helix-turn-helix domain-containing protein [Verrucosispora sp. WMMA2121]|uniref:helix-turn-helix domain-containing protein n=1 Tax=Verrucosispora sp. WMMA2121 TaxID=3015164 RepID=UPI003FCDAA8F